MKKKFFFVVFLFLSPSLIFAQKQKELETKNTISSHGDSISFDSTHFYCVNDTLLPDSIIWQKFVFNPSNNWNKANASYYDPLSRKQTGSGKGIGASGRRIRSGSVALGNPLINFFIKEGMIVYIEVKAPGFNIHTPYGKNIFRVDDKMAKRFRENYNKFFLDFEERDLNSRLKQTGRFNVEFRFLPYKQ